MKIKANGITINYRNRRPGRRAMAVFLEFARHYACDVGRAGGALKYSFRVLRYDQRGHGGTDAPAGRYAFDTLLDDALGLLDALSIGKAHFAGLSMGGATALGLAERHPDRFERIIVCDSPCQSTPQSSQQWEERIAVAQQSEGIVALVEPTIARWFPPETWSQKSAAPRQGARHDPLDAGQRLHRLRRGARRPRLCFRHRDGEVPGAVHERRKGRRTPAAMRKLAERLPGSRYRRAAGRRPYLQHGSVLGIHQTRPGFSDVRLNLAGYAFSATHAPRTPLQTTGGTTIPRAKAGIGFTPPLIQRAGCS
jgi:pimeloyl-ACP methyl ester carboxylesterase